MADRRQIGVRYCGGCNPRYDRVALVKRIGGFFPEAEFVTAQAGVKYPAVLGIAIAWPRYLSGKWKKITIIAKESEHETYIPSESGEGRSL